MILSSLSILLFAVALPILTGAGAAVFVKRQERNIVFMWMSGTILSWALFQLLAVPMILKRLPFHTLTHWYGICLAALAAAGGMLWLWRVRKIPRTVQSKTGRTGRELALWAAFGLLLLLQLVMAVVLAYGDGDDAYYVATSAVTVQTDTMYAQLPYTGGSTALDTRHCLAPFPILAAFYAKVSGLHPATVSHIVMPLLLIPLTYGIYGMAGSRLLAGRKKYLPLFLLFASLLVMWGNYSLYTAETFLLTRTRQGKAALGNMVIPACLLLILLLCERFSEGRRAEKALWLLLTAAVTASALCSTLGGFLSAMLTGVFGLCAAAAYKRWKLLFPIAVCAVPAVLYMGLYMLLR